MTDKEKAKAYDEAIKKAQEAANSGMVSQNFVDDIFQLRQSEDKRIIRAINNMLPFIPDEAYANNGVTKEGVLNWLEKHKEPIDPFDTKLFQEGVKEGRRLEREEIEKEQKPASSGSSEKPNNLLWSEDKFPKDIEKDATQFCFDKGFNITPYQAKEIATHYLMIGHNFGYVEGRKNAHIPAKELGLPSSMDFKQEWSEEDEKIRRNLMSLLANMRGDRITEETYQKYYPWLKDLRPSWKPSEEQIGALNYAYCELFKREDVGHNILVPLQKLLDGLKKLM